MKKNELSYKDLKDFCNPDIFKFKTTKELSTKSVAYGQERGIKALEFGLSIDSKGYNLYLEGPSGVGKTLYTKNYVKKIAITKPSPDDWCYIYNFDNPNEPIAISLPAGKGKEFKEVMDSFITDIRKDIKITFNNEDFEKEKTLIKQQFEEKRTKLLDDLNKQASTHGFQVKTAQNGIYMMPIIDGKVVNEDDFNNLDSEIKQTFEEKSSIVQEQIFEAIKKIKTIEKQSDSKVDEWQSNIALLTINTHINIIKNDYGKDLKIKKFLDDIKKDILKNLNLFIKEENCDVPNQPMKKEPILPWLNYRVNLFVDNSSVEGAPVIMDSNYSYPNLFGKLEYENQFRNVKNRFYYVKTWFITSSKWWIYNFASK